MGFNVEKFFRSGDIKPKSSLSFAVKYPALRDHPRHTANVWLRGKQIDDDIGKLWRIHDKLYDFTEFTKNHPGGKDWLELTQGTDITEAFEAHHISTLPENLLQHYFVDNATTPRNSPFTFEENGFYRTLKRKAKDVLKNIPNEASTLSKIYADGMFIAYVTLAILTGVYNSFALAVLAGVALCWTTIIAHNFFHRRDNFRMYYFDFCLMSSKSWRVTHALSHHIYTNTIYDYEISFLEPYFQYLVVEKNLLVKYGPWFYGIPILILTFPIFYIRMLLQVMEDGWKTFKPEALLPFTIPILMFILSKTSILQISLLFTIIILTASFQFGMVGLNAAHHHPKIFHDGDIPRSETLDWGLHQLDAVADRKDINWSHFLVITNFGDHCLHHLFPTVDHGLLKYLYPVVVETCKEFDSELRERTQLKLTQGQYLQLARTEPAPNNTLIKNTREQKG